MPTFQSRYFSGNGIEFLKDSPTKKEAVDYLLNFLKNSPLYDYGQVIKVANGGHYLTVFKNY